MQNIYQTLNSDDPVLITGKLDVSDERVLVVAGNVESALTLRNRRASEAFVRVRYERVSNARLEQLKHRTKPGTTPGTVKLLLSSRQSRGSPIAMTPNISTNISSL